MDAQETGIYTSLLWSRLRASGGLRWPGSSLRYTYLSDEGDDPAALNPRRKRAQMAKTTQNEWAPKAARLIQSLQQRTFTQRDLGNFLNREREHLGIPKSIGVNKFIDILSEEGKLSSIELVREVRTRAGVKLRPGVTRFAWGEPSVYDIALSLRSGSYLSHGTAVLLHGLTDRMPKTLYTNKEQSPKPRSRRSLSQAAIDRAFKAAQRASNYIFTWEGYRFVLLSGKHTGRLEVSQIEGEAGEILDITTIERTLIDITVRPVYAGGVYEVMAVFREARDQGISVDTLVKTLKKLDYLYPYHQAIGFYLERAGFAEDHLKKLRSMTMDFDFYLTHKISDSEYESGWRLYYPSGL